LVEVDDQSRQVKGVTLVQPPPHQPGLLPRWLHERGVTTVIAGGIGLRAQQLLAELGIEVIAGVPATNPQQLVEEYLTGQLASGNNPCHH
jgi:predicted Fe-Mo cluster-binding NifX family protein